MTHGAGYSDWVSETSTLIGQASDIAFRVARVSLADIDAAMLYEAFTINVPMGLEGAGFCRPGEAGRFVEDGNIDLDDGVLPVNPDGGALSSNNPGRRGLFLLVEAARQLRGEAGACQVAACAHVATIATGAVGAGRARAAAVSVFGRD